MFLLIACLGLHAIGYGQGAKALLEAPRVPKGTIQRFVFPQSSVNRIRQGIAAGKLDQVAAEQILKKQAAAADFNLQSNALLNKSLVAGLPVEKEVLVLKSIEEKFYAPEIDAGRAIRNQILSKKMLTPMGRNEVAQAITASIKNNTLYHILMEEFDRFDIGSMALDLTDYFCLDKPFEQAAFDYTVRHPHQMNLNMRRLMYNPLVDDGIKNRLRFFLESPSITPDQFGQFRMAIRSAHLQYKQRLAAAQNSDIIQAQIRYYQDLTTRLSDFIVENHHQPEWNTASIKEQELFDELDWVKANDATNQFPQILPYRQALQAVWDSAPAPTILPLEETLALFEQFVVTTGRQYPMSQREKLKKGQIAFKQEKILWDSLSFWRIQDESSTYSALTQIISKHSSN